MKKITLLLFLLLPMQMLWAQAEKSFPQYTWKNANIIGKDDSRFGYEPASFTPIFKNCHTLPKTDPCYEADEYADLILLGTYKNASMNEHVNIFYTPGPSIDPMFSITDKATSPFGKNLQKKCALIHLVLFTHLAT